MSSITASEGLAVLAELGVSIEVRDADTVTIQLGPKRTDARLHVRRSAPSRWDIRRDVEVNRTRGREDAIVLYVVPQATATLVEVASADVKIAVVSVRDGLVILAGERVEGTPVGNRGVSRNPSRVTRGRRGWARFALLRALLRTSHSRTQMELAAECGVSQVAISNALRGLGSAVVRERTGWRALRPEPLWEQFMAEYPGPGGITSYWLGLDSIARQATTARDAAAEEGGLVSGDPAADAIAPWRIGNRAVLYARTGVALAHLGFAETTRANATLDFVVPADPTIWATSRSWIASPFREMVDPILVAWDVQCSGGPDAAEAVTRIQRTVLAEWFQ